MQSFIYKIIIFSILTVSIGACQQSSKDDASTTAETTNTGSDETIAVTDAVTPETSDNEKVEVIATINSKDITMSDFEIYVERRMQDDPSAISNPASMLNELINKELLLQEAMSKGYDKRKNVAILIQQETEGIIVSALVQEQLADVDLSDAALQSEYDTQIGQMVLNEYKGRHILLGSEEDAHAIMQELDQGADFEELAKSRSTGPSASKGGDLGWFQADSMVPPFADAVKNLKKGETTSTPVQTRFGWHIIKLEDSRELDRPEFEASKERLKAIIANKAAQDYLADLREKATIDIKNPETGDSVSVTEGQLTEGASNQ